MVMVARMIAAAWEATTRMLLIFALLVSLGLNFASFTVNSVSSAASLLIETIMGVETLITQLRNQDVKLAMKTDAASKWEGKAIGTAHRLEKELAARKTVESSLTSAQKLASKWEGTAIGTALTLERERSLRKAVESEVITLRAARRVIYDGAEMTVQEAITRATGKIKMRTVKLASADLSATAAQAVPWIGVAAVVAATGYDLKMSCETMKDMHAIELAVNPAQVDDPKMDYVCGLRVPTEDEVWQAIKASPRAVWDTAQSVLQELPSVPAMTEFGWPSLPDMGMPSAPDIKWDFWK